MASLSGKEATRKLLEEIKITTKSYEQDDANARAKLIALSYQLAATLELPSETIARITWAEPARYAGCITGIDLNLFQMLAEKEDKSWTVQELAERSGAEAALLARFLKLLAAMNIVKETGINEYRTTSISTALTQPALGNGMKFLHDVIRVSVGGMPSYFESNGYTSPLSVLQGPFQWAFKTELPFFGWLKERPQTLQNFSRYMTGYRSGKKAFLDIYPFEERIIPDFDSNGQALLVDLGGGTGHDLVDIRAKFSILPGDLILQDLPQVISQIPDSQSDKKFKPLAHDFFQPQPVKDARAYYLHSVLHDWDDQDCHKILSQIVPVMKRGYSKVLINELVVPDTGASWEVTSLDLVVLSVGNSKERTEKEWRNMLSDVGLQVTDILEGDRESIIEAQLA